MASLIRTSHLQAAHCGPLPVVSPHWRHRTPCSQALALPARLPAGRPSCHRRRGLCIHAQAASPTASKPSLGQRVRGLLQLLPSAKCISVLQLVSQLLRKHFWAVVIIYALKDALQFALHRATHRLTNFAAEAIFKYPISEEVINAWWLVLDQEFLQQYPGYQVVMAVLFLVAMPLNLLLSGVASASTILLCCPEPHPFSTASLAPASTNAGDDALTTAAEQPVPSYASSSSSSSSSGPADPAVAASGQEAGSQAASSLAAAAAPLADATAPAAPSSSGSSSSSSGSDGRTAGPSVAGSAGSASTGAAVGAATTSSHNHGSGDAPGEAEPPSNTAATASTATSPPDGGSSSSAPAAQEASSSSSSAAVAAGAEKKPRGWFAPLREGWREAFSPLPQVRGMLRRVWWTESVVSVIGLALQAGMMLVVPLPWLLPIYLSAQLAGVAAVKMGGWGLKAIDSSAALMKGRKRIVFWPLLGLILAASLVDKVKVAAFAAMPQRLWTEAVEVPLAAYVLLQALRVVVSRMQDLLPAGLYLHLLQELRADRQVTEMPQAASPRASSS